MPLTFSKSQAPAIPLYAVSSDGLDGWLRSLDPVARAWAETVGFKAAAGKTMTMPDADGRVAMAAVGLGDSAAQRRRRFLIGAARAALPAGDYALSGVADGPELEEAALGWLLAGYRFARYAKSAPPQARLVAPVGLDAKKLQHIAAAEGLTRDLINTPASDMGPGDLEQAARTLAGEFGAEISVITGQALHEAHLPMIHAVGRAASREPRLLDLKWGDAGPRLTLVGKGVCFDTGGLNIKPGASMGLMKKDMGGAATVLGLARMIMALGLELRLRVLIPAVENSIGGDAFRPQDILTSRKGLTVEINNTDAEGRLVLADALALADEGKPDLILSMATLTGAARVAVGPDLAPFYATQGADARAVAKAAAQVRDPVWQMPFWDPYEEIIEPGIADLDNAPKGGMAGSITAALFLRRFVTETPRYMHFDIYGWQPSAAPARPKGGVGQGARAILQALPDLLSL
jgi:leucyl aminopeptidase